MLEDAGAGLGAGMAGMSGGLAGLSGGLAGMPAGIPGLGGLPGTGMPGMPGSPALAAGAPAPPVLAPLARFFRKSKPGTNWSKKKGCFSLIGYLPRDRWCWTGPSLYPRSCGATQCLC